MNYEGFESDYFTQEEMRKLLNGESIYDSYADKLGALYDAQELTNSLGRSSTVLYDGKVYRGMVTYVDCRSDRFIVEVPENFSSGYLDINKVQSISVITPEINERRDVKIWVDNMRPAPDGFIQANSVCRAIDLINIVEAARGNISLIDTEFELGEYTFNGGDGKKLIEYLIVENKFYPVKVHTNNIVAKEQMESLIKQYWPEEKKR